jgi:hypothetical protein
VHRARPRATWPLSLHVMSRISQFVLPQGGGRCWVQRVIYYVGYRKIGGQSDSLQCTHRQYTLSFFHHRATSILMARTVRRLRHDRQACLTSPIVYLEFISYVYKSVAIWAKRTIRHGHSTEFVVCFFPRLLSIFRIEAHLFTTELNKS